LYKIYDFKLVVFRSTGAPSNGSGG